MTGDISLYFHIPFCSKKCPYCHFFVLPDLEKYKRPFMPALIKEWQMRLPQLKGKKIVSLYFGGGTPTKLDARAYAPLLDSILSSGVEIASECEITLEANPEDVSLKGMQEFYALGINRVSLGVQSLIDEELVLLGRTHNVNRSVDAIHQVKEAGIDNISIDLMFELPYQNLNRWQKTLSAVAHLPVTHLSLYNLTFEPHTVFFKQRQQLIPQLPPDEERLEMLETAIAMLESFGLSRYEISAFAKRGAQSRHNTGYWTGRPFFGFGPSAFSYWEGARFSNAANLNQYLTLIEQNRFPIDFEEKLLYPRNLQELFAIGLRLAVGVDLSSFTAAHGEFPLKMEKALSALIQKGFLAQEGGVVKLTSSGQLFYDSVAAEIV